MGIYIEDDPNVTVDEQTKRLRVPGPAPESLQPEAQRLFKEAQTQLQQDFPGLKFGRAGKNISRQPDFTLGSSPPPDFEIGGIAKPAEAASAAQPAAERSGFIVGAAQTIKAKIEQRATDFPQLYNRHQAVEKELEAKRAEVLPAAVAEARATKQNILDIPAVKTAAKEVGIRPDAFILGVETYINKSPEELQKIVTENRAAAAEHRRLADVALEIHKEKNAEIAGYRPEFAPGTVMGTAGSVAFDAVTSLPDMALTVIAGAVNPALGSATLFTSILPYYAAEGKAQGMDDRKAETYGILMAAGEAIPETAVLERLAGVNLRRVVGEHLVKALGKEVLGIGVTEGISEMVTEVYQQGLEVGLYDKKTTLSQVLKDIAYAGATGFVMGAPIGGAAVVADRLKNRGENAPPGKPAAPTSQPTPAPGTPPATAVTPPGAPPPGVPPGGPPGPPGGGAPAVARPAPKAGDHALFQPNATAPGTVIQILSVNPKSGDARVVRIDQDGNPVLNADGEPAAFIASFEDMQFAAPASPPAPAAPTSAVAAFEAPPAAVTPDQAPPAMTSVEPTSDIAAQIKDMRRRYTPRRGVYLSAPTVAKMKAEGTYDTAISVGASQENFDGQGGTLIVKTKPDLEEAIAARDSGKTDMQEIIGLLTGAGVKKPRMARPAVVQRRDETGGVVQQSAVVPEEVPAAVAAANELPGTTEVTTPDAVIAEREAKVAAERAAPGDTFAAVEFALKTALDTLNTPKEGGGLRAVKPDVRVARDDVGMAAAMLRQAAAEAGLRGAPPEVVAAATVVAAESERLPDKTEADTVKARGTSEPKLRLKLARIRAAFETLLPYRNNPKQAAPAIAAPKGEAAKRGVKKPGQSSALNKLGDEQTAVVLATPEARAEVAQDTQKNRDLLIERELAATKAKEAEARKELPPAVAVAMERVERARENERRKAAGVPPAGVAERRHGERRATPTPQVGPTGFAAGKERRRIRGKPPEGVLERRGQDDGQIGEVWKDPETGEETPVYILSDSRQGETVRVRPSAMGQEYKWGSLGKIANISDLQLSARRGPQVGATGVQIAPPGQRVIHRKKKYVAPKKAEPTVEEIAAKVAAETAPEKRETIEVTPSSVTGNEEEFINELMGASSKELQQEIRLDSTGQMQNLFKAIVAALENRNSWVGLYAAITRGGVLTREQRNSMLQLIREYAAATRQDLPAVHERMLGLLTNLDGKTLPMHAIGAVFEAANVVRAYTTIASAQRDLAEDMDSDLSQIEEATTTTAFDMGLVKKEGGSMGVARENEVGGKGKPRGGEPGLGGILTRTSFLGRILGRVSQNQLRQVLEDLYVNAQRQGWLKNFVEKSFAAAKAKTTLPGTHEFLDYLLSNTQGLSQGSRPYIALLTHIRARVPNVPIEFTPEGEVLRGPYGESMGEAGEAWFFQSGSIAAHIRVNSSGAPVLDVSSIPMILHEIMHAATAFEFVRNPNGALAREINALRMEILEKARGKFGADRVNAMLEFFEKGRFEDKPTPPSYYKDLYQILYGLSNGKEFMAEIFTRPQFVELLANLDQSPAKTWMTQKWNVLVNSLSRFFGFRNPADSRILNDAMALTLRMVDKQSKRAMQLARAVDKLAGTLVTELKISKEQATQLAAMRFGDLPINYASESDAAYMYTGKKISSTAIQASVEAPDGPFPATDADGYFAQAVLGDLDFLTQSLNTKREMGDQYRAAGAEPGVWRLKNQEEIGNITTPQVANAIAGLNRVMKSRFMDSARDKAAGLWTMDYLVNRTYRLFGATRDALNPLWDWNRVRMNRNVFANQLRELAQKTVNSKWMGLSPHRSAGVGNMLQQTTFWQIHPDQGIGQEKLMAGMSKVRWENKVREINALWAGLDAEQQDIYHSVQKYYQVEYAKLRRAGVDLAAQLFGGQLTDQQRTLLYTMRKTDDIDKLVGPGLLVDVGAANEKLSKVLHDLIRVSAIKGPYFPLMRDGKYVVEAEREGILDTLFNTKAEANVEVDKIRNRAPKNTARIVAHGDQFEVHYKVRDVSFHNSQSEAEAARAALASAGLKAGVFTRKTDSIKSLNLSEGLNELVGKASALAEKEGSAEQMAVVQSIQAAFVQILAERAAAASAQLKRKGVGGFKPSEAHETFARSAQASSWHYANLKTAMDQMKAMTRLRSFARDPTQGVMPPHMTPQQLVLTRGRVVAEITRRMQIESDEMNTTSSHRVDSALGQLGFINFLVTPSYAFINMMQNFNVALPYVVAKYGRRGVKSMMRAMKLVAGPAFAKALRGLVNRPGTITSYDVYTAIAEAVAEDPRFEKFTKPRGDKPSALQELVDMNVITASFVQELSSIANNQNINVARGMEYLRLLPQASELFNRVSTSLAVLEVTNGDVEAAAETVWRVHFGYELGNRPRYFRSIGGYRVPQFITMFKMYGVGMYQTGASLVVDAVSRRGQSAPDRARSAAALAGIIAMHTLSAGLIGGAMLEPLRALRALWNLLFHDRDEPDDLNSEIEKWAKEVTDSFLAGRMLSHGIFNAIGVDVSARMGLDNLLLYNPQEGWDEAAGWKLLGQLLGPIPAMIIQKRAAAYDLAVNQGKPLQAIMELIPARLFQDARKAWGIMNSGVQTKSGETVVGADAFGAFDAAQRVLGFKTTEEATAQNQASTIFEYHGWRTARVKVLSNAFWRAQDSGDPAAIAAATAAISQFNDKHPNAPISLDSLIQSKRGAQTSAAERRGEGRNPELNERLGY